MALKPRYKRRIIWSILSVIATLTLAIIIVPSMITLNKFKPMIENAIETQTNVPAKLNGDLNFSLLSGATIVAHDVHIPTAQIGAVMISIPFRSLFNLSNPALDDTVTIYNANITIQKLVPATFNHNIKIYDSDIHFMGRNFHIISAEMINNKFTGIIRTANHKYDVEFSGDTFHIKNKNNNLDITGQFFDNGTIRGHISLETDDINSWLNISEPKITEKLNLSMNFEWNGDTGFKYTNIHAGNFSGNIEIQPNGTKIIQLNAENINYDFSFLLNPGDILNNTQYNLDFYGDLTFLSQKFNHIKINTISANNQIQVTNIVADDIALTGGYINANGAHNIMINMPFHGTESTCVFSGTPNNWKCTPYSYGDINGNLSVNNKSFDMTITSENKMPKNGILSPQIKSLGTHGKIQFQFSDVAGTYHLDGDKTDASFTYAHDKTLRWANVKLPFLPGFMNNDIGDFIWYDNMMDFSPHNKKWRLQITDKQFVLSGKSAHTWVPELDLRAIRDMPYTISGTYDNGKISDLVIEISDTKFKGSFNDKNLTLHTAVLDLDKFISNEFISKYSELEFLTNAPILIPFGITINISLSADKLIYKDNEFANFVYSLRDKAQIFSITDNARGNLLATIEKDKTNYEIFIQLNKFIINKYLLNESMPLNIRDTMITAEIHMNTNGQIAHDIWYNLTGEMDMSFDGGYISGLSIDDFYSSADNINTLNLEFALSNALGGGETQLKTMRIVGKYNNGNFTTTQPLSISMRHVDGIGTIEIENQEMYTTLDLTMRGTSPAPSVIQLNILPDGTRQYALSEILINFDSGYLSEFIRTHNKF